MFDSETRVFQRKAILFCSELSRQLSLLYFIFVLSHWEGKQLSFSYQNALIEISIYIRMILVSVFLFYKKIASQEHTRALSPPALKPFLILSVPFKCFIRIWKNVIFLNKISNTAFFLNEQLDNSFELHSNNTLFKQVKCLYVISKDQLETQVIPLLLYDS